jgi:hypothetical protein
VRSHGSSFRRLGDIGRAIQGEALNRIARVAARRVNLGLRPSGGPVYRARYMRLKRAVGSRLDADLPGLSAPALINYDVAPAEAVLPRMVRQ